MQTKRLLHKILVLIMVIELLSFSYMDYTALATPFFVNGQFTPNGIEWCQENFQLYKILGTKFFEHHRYSLESRVCASLYSDPLWNYDSPDRIQKLVERSLYYSQLEIAESIEESKTGIINPTPATGKNATLLHGVTEDGQIEIKLVSSKPTANTPLLINLSFLDSNKLLIPNVSYSIKVTQKETIVMQNNGYSEKGLVAISTLPLSSDKPVNVNVTINGIGLPDNENLLPSKGQVVTFTVIPEFGTIATIVLVIAMLSSIIITKHRYNILR